MNASLVASIASQINSTSVGIIVDGGPADALGSIGEANDGYVTLGGRVYAIGDRTTMPAQDRGRIGQYASYVDVATVAGFASVTAIGLLSVSGDEVAVGTTDGATSFEGT